VAREHLRDLLAQLLQLRAVETRAVVCQHEVQSALGLLTAGGPPAQKILDFVPHGFLLTLGRARGPARFARRTRRAPPRSLRTRQSAWRSGRRPWPPASADPAWRACPCWSRSRCRRRAARLPAARATGSR